MLKPTLWLLLVCFALPLTARGEYVVIAHPECPASTLSSDQVRAIFNGNIKAFPDSSVLVSVLDQPMRSEGFRDFYRHVFKLTPEKVKRRRAAYLFSGQGMIPDTLPDDNAILGKVSSDKTAIGYIKADNLSANVKVLFRFP